MYLWESNNWQLHHGIIVNLYTGSCTGYPMIMSIFHIYSPALYWGFAAVILSRNLYNYIIFMTKYWENMTYCDLLVHKLGGHVPPENRSLAQPPMRVAPITECWKSARLQLFCPNQRLLYFKFWDKQDLFIQSRTCSLKVWVFLFLVLHFLFVSMWSERHKLLQNNALAQKSSRN